MRRIISASALSFGTVVVFGSIISRYESPNAARKTPIAINNIPNVARIFLPSGVFTDLSESEIPDCISSDDAVLRISLIPFKNFIVDFLFLLKLHRLITIYIACTLALPEVSQTNFEQYIKIQSGTLAFIVNYSAVTLSSISHNTPFFKKNFCE